MSLKRFTSLHPVADLPQLLALFGTKRETDAQEGSRSWYNIRNAAGPEAEVYIYDEIGYWGITANDFIGNLRDIKATKIALYINSPGGDVFDGVAINNALLRHPAELTVWIDGIAASAASFIAMAGDEVVMSPHGQMMIHEASGLTIGPADDMRKMAEILDKQSDNIASFYAERTGGTVEEWRDLMRDETWFSDREAVEVGLADRVDGDGEEKPPVKAQLEDPSTPEDLATVAVLAALRNGTGAVVQKEVLPAFDFGTALREGAAV